MTAKGTEQRKELRRRDWKQNPAVYLMFLPLMIYFIIFNYIPMTGILMSFEKYSVGKGTDDCITGRMGV